MKKILIISLLFFVPCLFFSTKNVFAYGTAYTDSIGTTHYSNGSTSYTDTIGTTHYSDGSTAYTDSIGTTHYNGGLGGNTGTSYTNSIGTTHFNFSGGPSGSVYTDSIGTTHYSDNEGNYGTAYTDSIGTTHYNGDIFISNSCPSNSAYDSLLGKCKCNFGYRSNGSSCVYGSQNIPIYPTYPLTRNTYSIQNINHGYAPTCNILFIPKTAIIGETVTSSLKTTGFITNVHEIATGFINTNRTLSSSDYPYFFNLLNNGKSFPEKIVPNQVGESSETYTVTGPAGSSSCTASFITTPKQATASSNAVMANQQTSTPIVNTPPTLQKKMGWFSRFLSWFKK